MLALKRLFFPFRKLPTAILQVIHDTEDQRLFFGELSQAVDKLYGREVSAARLHLTVTRLMTEGFLGKRRWTSSNGSGNVQVRNQYLLTYKGRDLVREGLTFPFSRC